MYWAIAERLSMSVLLKETLKSFNKLPRMRWYIVGSNRSCPEAGPCSPIAVPRNWLFRFMFYFDKQDNIFSANKAPVKLSLQLCTPRGVIGKASLLKGAIAIMWLVLLSRHLISLCWTTQQGLITSFVRQNFWPREGLRDETTRAAVLCSLVCSVPLRRWGYESKHSTAGVHGKGDFSL